MKVITSVGQTIDLGMTETTPTIGLTDYSRRVTDDYGVTTVVPRGFSRRLSVRLGVSPDKVDALQQRLASLRATSARWVADPRFASLVVDGFYKDFDIDVATAALSYCTLTVEGLAETSAFVDHGGDPAPAGVSTLRMLRPIRIDDAALVACSVSETDHAVWSAGVTYPKGARVQVAGRHRIYESVVANNVGADPSGASGKWLDVGPTNRWAAFDQALGTATTAPGSITVTLAGAAIGAVALLDVTAATVRVQATGYDRTTPVDAGAVTFLDLPADTTQVTVTITGPGNVAVGTLLAGTLVGLGITEASPTAGITDYSRKVVDDFGAVTIVERAWAKRMTARALIDTDAIDTVFGRIASVRATPVLWIGSQGLNCLTIYGFFRDFSIEVGETVSKLSLSIEGLSTAGKTAPLVADQVPWPAITDPNGKKPADNATNSADPASPLGDSTVGKVLKDVGAGRAAAEAALKQVTLIDTVTIPAIDKAVSDAGDRITVAQKAADDGLKAAGANAKTIIDLRSTLASAFALVSRGLSTPLAGRREAGIYNAAGAQVMTANRGWNVVTWTADNAIASVKTFDTLGGLYDGGVAAMVAYLNGLADGTTITVHTWDEPHTNHMLPALVAAMQRCGAGEGFTSADWQYRGAYVLIGQAGVGRGNGDELYRGSPGDSGGPTDAYIDKPFSLLKGKPQRIGLGTAVDSQIRQVATTAANAEKAVAGLSTSVDTRFSGVNDTLGRHSSSITALSDADKGFASRATALEASVRAVPTMLNGNASFSDWPDAQTLPSLWAGGAAPNSIGRVAGKVGRYAMRQVFGPGQGGVNTFIAATGDATRWAFDNPMVWDNRLNIGAGWYVFEADLELESGQLVGSGMYLGGYDKDVVAREEAFFDFASEAGGYDVPQGVGTPGKRYRFSKLIQLSDPRIAFLRFHPMTAYERYGRGYNPYKTLVWHLAGIRRATDLEIKAGKADAALNASNGVLARLTSHDSALANLPQQYAAASRADLLEAQVNGETGSRLLSRAESKATALVDGLNGAVNGRMDIMVSEYNGIGAALKQQSGTLAGVDGRTAVYWEVLGTTSDGKTRVRLSKSNGSRGIFYVDADMVVDGNLLVTGTLPLGALQRGQFSRYAEQHWSGDVSPFPGQKQTLIDTSMPGIGAGGSFTWEVYVDFVTNEGKREVQGNYNNSGYPLYTDFRADGGIGVNLMNGGAAVISDVNPRTNRGYGRVVVYGGGAFDGRLLADIFNNSYDSGVIRDGDYFRREVSATYRVYSVMIKVRWTFI